MSTELRRDLALRARYSQGAGIFRIVPRAVAHPTSVADVADLLRQAVEARLPIIPRGSGSAMDGSSVGDGLVLDVSALDAGRGTVDPTARRAVVSPSLTFGELDRRAAAHGLRLPPNPSSGAFATLGGIVSTNASGARSVRYGSIRPWVVGLELETVDGPLSLRRGTPPDAAHPAVSRWRSLGEPMIARHRDAIRARFPRVRKNSAGYALDHYLASGDLLDLVIGSEGTLGVITGITVRLDPVPPHRASLRVLLTSRAQLAAALEALRSEDPSTLEFLDASFLRLVDPETVLPGQAELWRQVAGLVLVDIEGDDPDDVAERTRREAAAVAPYAHEVRIALDAAEIERLWHIRHAASPVLAALRDGRRSLQVIEDGCVPTARFAEYLDAVDAACAAEGVDAVTFGHVGDGNLHVNLLPNLRESDWLARVRRIYAAVSEAAIRLGGTPTGEHGAGRLRAGLMARLYGPEVLACFRAVKQSFDPSGLLNPGVILDHGDDPFGHLAVGADAPPLPPGSEEYLLDIERHARWAESRWLP
jgi:FAD/FMN-containing dehydrogenase